MCVCVYVCVCVHETYVTDVCEVIFCLPCSSDGSLGGWRTGLNTEECHCLAEL